MALVKHGAGKINAQIKVKTDRGTGKKTASVTPIEKKESKETEKVAPVVEKKISTVVEQPVASVEKPQEAPKPVVGEKADGEAA